MTYTLAYTNNGPSDAQEVHITDTLPMSVTYGGVVSSPFAGPTQTGRSLTWYTPTLAAGARGSIIFTVTVDAGAGGVLTNNVVITSATLDSALGDNEAWEQTIVNPALVITKTAIDLNGPPLYAGDEIEYRVVATDICAAHHAQDHVIISDSAPTYTTFVMGSVTCSPGATCGERGSVITASIDSLGPGAALTLAFRVTVNPDAGGYTIHNQAGVVSDQRPDPLLSSFTANEVTPMPSLTLNKWAAPDASQWADTWTQYHFQVANTGGVTLTSIQIWDDQLGPEIGILSVPDLAAGEEYVVKRWWPVNGDTRNVATVTAHAPNFPGLLSASDDAYFDFIEGLTITLDVSAQPETIPAAQTVSYTYRLINTSGDWLEGGVITDTVYGIVASGLSLAPGASYTGVFMHSVVTTTVSVAYAWGADRLGNPVTATDVVTVAVGASEDCVLYLPLVVRNY